jgi:hypothetical protein
VGATGRVVGIDMTDLLEIGGGTLESYQKNITRDLVEP